MMLGVWTYISWSVGLKQQRNLLSVINTLKESQSRSTLAQWKWCHNLHLPWPPEGQSILLTGQAHGGCVHNGHELLGVRGQQAVEELLVAVLQGHQQDVSENGVEETWLRLHQIRPLSEERHNLTGAVTISFLFLFLVKTANARSAAVPSLVQRVDARFVTLHHAQHLHVLRQEAGRQQAVDAQLQALLQGEGHPLQGETGATF